MMRQPIRIKQGLDSSIKQFYVALRRYLSAGPGVGGARRQNLSRGLSIGGSKADGQGFGITSAGFKAMAIAPVIAEQAPDQRPARIDPCGGESTCPQSTPLEGSQGLPLAINRQTPYSRSGS